MTSLTALFGVFKDIDFLNDIPKELMDWLNKPKETPGNYDEETARKNMALDYKKNRGNAQGKT